MSNKDSLCLLVATANLNRAPEQLVLWNLGATRNGPAIRFEFIRPRAFYFRNV
jgi:hypothetical protein